MPVSFRAVHLRPYTTLQTRLQNSPSGQETELNRPEADAHERTTHLEVIKRQRGARRVNEGDNLGSTLRKVSEEFKEGEWIYFSFSGLTLAYSRNSCLLPFPSPPSTYDRT